MDGKRARKPNFSAAECSLILQLAEENLDTIREKFSNNLTNKKKHKAWQHISDRVNALGVAKRTTTEIKEKWRAMCGVARKDIGREKKAQGKTGGGKPPPPPTATSQRIIELFGDEPGFSGIEGGMESGTSFATESQCTVVELVIPDEVILQAPTDPIESPDDQLMPVEDDDENDEVPKTSTKNPIPATPMTTTSKCQKRRKVTHQDIQRMQLDVLCVEKQKIELEMENFLLAKQKLQLEVAELMARNNPFVNGY